MTIKTTGVRIYKEACGTQYSYKFHIGHNTMKTIRVTIFGDSAGTASAGHLMLSQEATGLFHQVSLILPVGMIIDHLPSSGVAVPLLCFFANIILI